MFSPDGRWIAAGTSPPVLVNVSTGEIAGRFPQGTKVPTFSPDGRWIAAGNENEIMLWKWDGEELIQERSWKSTDTASFWDFRFGADGAHLASVQEASVQGGQRVKVWDVATGDELASQLGVQAYWLAMHPTRRQVAVPSNNGRIRLWNYAGRDDGLTTVPLAVGNRGKFSPDGRWIAVASGGLVSLLEAGSGKVLNTIEGHLTSAPWLPDSRHIVVSRKPENTLELRDAMTGELLRSFPGQSAGKVSSYVSQDGLNVTSVADFRDKVIRVWDVQSGRLKSEFRLQDVGWFGSEHIAVWGTRVAIGYDSRIEFWDTETASRTRTLPMPGRNYFIMVFSRDGERLFAGSNGGVLTLHDITTGQELKRFIGHRRIANLALSPDETQLLARDSLGRVIVWDVESAQPLISPSDAGESNLVWRTAGGSELDWSPDNQRILVGTSDGLQIWTLPHSGS